MALRLALGVCALLAAGAARRLDQDFEFIDDKETLQPGAGASVAHHPHRYIYDPRNALCSALVCKKRELCLLRPGGTALCLSKKEALRRGDVIVSAPEEEDPAGDDVFYESGAPPPAAPARCVGCPPRAGAFLCGSDNRTYSSLCRLDLHNCVRRPRPPVALACRGFCPCHPAPAPAAPACRPERMADRLLDWFAVLMEEAGSAPPPRAAFPPDCKPEVRWMFAHLDVGGDGALSSRDLYALRHDSRERCLRPFLSACGGGALDRGAWCGCLSRAARPCAALARAHAADAARGGYAPACDARGYYRPRQCHRALGVCWCVDAHGAEVAGSRARGRVTCRAPPAAPRPAAPADDDEDAPQGSGDGASDRNY